MKIIIWFTEKEKENGGKMEEAKLLDMLDWNTDDKKILNKTFCFWELKKVVHDRNTS